MLQQKFHPLIQMIREFSIFEANEINDALKKKNKVNDGD